MEASGTVLMLEEIGRMLETLAKTSKNFADGHSETLGLQVSVWPSERPYRYNVYGIKEQYKDIPLTEWCCGWHDRQGNHHQVIAETLSALIDALSETLSRAHRSGGA